MAIMDQDGEWEVLALPITHSPPPDPADPGGDASTIAYGPLPPRFFAHVRDRFLERDQREKSSRIRRTEQHHRSIVPLPYLAQAVRVDISCRDLPLAHCIEIARSVQMLALLAITRYRPRDVSPQHDVIPEVGRHAPGPRVKRACASHLTAVTSAASLNRQSHKS
jgi:hypothetical protein